MWLEKVTVGVNVNNIKEKIDEKKIAFFLHSLAAYLIDSRDNTGLKRPFCMG